MYEVKHLDGTPVIGTHDFDVFDQRYAADSSAAPAPTEANSCEKLFGPEWNLASHTQLNAVAGRLPFYSGVMSADRIFVPDSSKIGRFAQLQTTLVDAIKAVDVRINQIESGQAPVTATSGPRLLRRHKVQKTVYEVELRNLQNNNDLNPYHLKEFFEANAPSSSFSYQLPVACVATVDAIDPRGDNDFDGIPNEEDECDLRSDPALRQSILRTGPHRGCTVAQVSDLKDAALH